MFKKVLVAVTAMVMMAVGVLAYTDTVNGIEWDYTAGSGMAEAGISGIPVTTTGAITIPSSLGGYPVTSIEPDAFSGCSGLTSVTIPDSVTSIRGSAFYGCSDLKSAIFLGDAPRDVGDYIEFCILVVVS